jgi:hypothetical protein
MGTKIKIVVIDHPPYRDEAKNKIVTIDSPGVRQLSALGVTRCSLLPRSSRRSRRVRSKLRQI